MSKYFAPIRRGGFDIGLSAGKPTKALVELGLLASSQACRLGRTRNDNAG